MCGIFAIFGAQESPVELRQKAIALSKKLRHRGPDWSGAIVSDNNVLCHERLAIVGVESGAQPLTNADASIILSVNGEIYNYRELTKLLKTPRTFKTKSDCEVIMYLYEEMGADMVKLLDGMFSFVLFDKKKNEYLVARDPIGITTLYKGTRSSDGSIWFASEMKALNEDCDEITVFPPGYFYHSKSAKFVRYFSPEWFEEKLPFQRQLKQEASIEDLGIIRESLIKAVRKRLMSEVPFGVLLSGGLDSSLIASIAVKELERKRKNTFEDNQDVDKSDFSSLLHSFSIGLQNSPDLIAAKSVAKHLGTKHYEFTFELEEGIDAIPDVISHLETYDVTTVRASTPMFLLSRKIKAIGVKMVLSGEGSDEIFGGYLYFHAAPNVEAFHAETIDRVLNLHTSDCLRANKSTMAWGLEARVPFLDQSFLEAAMTLDPTLKVHDKSKNRIEKWILRQAFDPSVGEEYLPAEILWRQKEQFSDGVGYSWIDGLKDHAERLISDEMMEKAKERFPQDTPTTKEAFWYRDVFEQLFPQKACIGTVKRWIPRTDWGCSADPSGRAQKVHEQAYEGK